jgi:heme A synthase
VTDFDVQISGAELREWGDPSREGYVSRVNARDGHPMRRWVAQVDVPVTITGIVGGVVGPLDASLAGRLFRAASTETPDSIPAVFTSLSGSSSVQSFNPSRVGHYLVYLRRAGGGGHFVHLDSEV